MFFIYWQFGHYQLIFSPKTWAGLGPEVAKSWKQKFNVYGYYLFFYSMNVYYCLLHVKSMVDYIAPDYFSLKITSPKVFNSFGPKMGIFVIIVNSHATFVWLLGTFFYMVVLGLINEKLAQFVDELKEVEFL